MSELKIQVAEALVLKPGDRVLLHVGDGRWDAALAADAEELLRERFPDVEFTFVTGVERVAVERTCQANSELRLGVESHVCECVREEGHRSKVHRCKCGCEWWQRGGAS